MVRPEKFLCTFLKTDVKSGDGNFMACSLEIKKIPLLKLLLHRNLKELVHERYN
jgi:hypothetical protein